MKKILMFGICAFFLVITNAQAKLTATLVGRNYGSNNIDTSVDVSNAYLRLYSLGPVVNQSTNPTIGWMKGSSNGLKRMENNILFFSGHGNSTGMHFYNSDNSSSSYNFYIKATSNTTNTVGLSSYDMSKVKLAVFAGCETGAGTSNITKSVYNKGAKGTLGWSTSINASAHTAWLNNFWFKIASGSSLAQAVASANSSSYTDNRVKNTVYYGGTFAGLGGTGDYLLQTKSDILANDDNKNQKYAINEQINNTDVYSSLLGIINDKFGINLKKYNFNVTKEFSNEEEVYDYMFLINEKVKTTIGYTLFVNNDIVETIYDNTKNITYGEIEEQFNEKYGNIDLEEMTNSLPNNSSYLFYDYEKNQLYKVIVNKIVDEFGASSSLDQFIEVN